ncbi:hypothetical protein ACU4HD_02835 [Cupriavidus basilensis]
MSTHRKAVDCAEALTHLWMVSGKSLCQEDLQWLTGLSEKAEVELRSFADLLSDAGARVGLCGAHGIDDDTVSSLLFSAANLTRNAAAMVFVGSEAGYLLAQLSEGGSPDPTTKPKSGGAR